MNPNGIGLGLYICKKVIKLCGGKIYISKSVLRIENPFKQGTKFVFTMAIDNARQMKHDFFTKRLDEMQ